MARVFERYGYRRLIALGIGLASIVAVLSWPPVGAVAASYQLYYAFELPLALQGFVVTDDGTNKTYTGTLRGTFGGLPVQTATYTYGAGASQRAGGGSFSLATAAGTIRNGQILMTTDGKRTTLIFFGLYLGTRVEFSIIADGELIGGTGVTATGLASTGFRSHSEYIEAVRTAVASLQANTRDQILSQADANPRLVSEYQQKLTPR